MKTVYDDKNQMSLQEPETPVEAVQTLRDFLLCHIELNDMHDPEFIKSHFKVCIDQIKEMKE